MHSKGKCSTFVSVNVSSLLMINTEVRERILLARMDGSEEIETDLEF